MSLLSLPNELLLQITEDFSITEIHSLVLTNRRLYNLLTSLLITKFALPDNCNCVTALYLVARYKREAQIRLILEGEKGQISITDKLLSDDSTIDEKVKCLLRTGAKSVIRDRTHGKTALHWAVGRKREAMVRRLLEGGIGVSVRGRGGATALHQVIYMGFEGLVRLLLDSGAIVDSKDRMGFTPLQLAALNKCKAITKMLLERGASVSTRDIMGETALHRAVMSGYEPVVRLMLEHCTDVNIPGFGGDTPLHRAIGNGNLLIARLLMEKGADCRIEDNYGLASLTFAIEGSHLGMVKLLAASSINGFLYSCKKTALHIAAAKSCRSVVPMLLDMGADMEITSIDGLTALHIAAENGKVAVVETLLRKGANIAARCDQQQTALHFAVLRRQIDVVKLLLEKGIEIDALDMHHNTALSRAIQWKYRTIVDLLLEKGASIGVGSQNRKIVFLYALGIGYMTGNTDMMVKFLLDSGDDVSWRYYRTDGQTPLHIAVCYNDATMVKLLLENGADITLLNDDGFTALEVAEKMGRVGIFESLGVF